MDVIGKCEFYNLHFPSLCTRCKKRTLLLFMRCNKMNEKKNKYEKKFQFQQKMISRQSEQIEKLKSEIEQLTLECQKKDELIRAVEPMRKEMAANIKEHKRLKNEYRQLIQELKMMKSIMNREVYKKRWWLIRLFLR